MSSNVTEKATAVVRPKSDVTRTPLSQNKTDAGFVAPVIGRTALKDVLGYYNLPLIRKGDVVTNAHIDRATCLGRLYELIAATDKV